jgi:TrmH family RNA methyltransferase
VNYVDLNPYFEIPNYRFWYFMDGLNIYKATLPREGIIIMGNEANGISEDLES